ncbi:MFS transporter, partial [Micromonospora sp. KC721]
AMAAGFGSGVAWVGGGLAAAVLAVLLVAIFPALLRYRVARVAARD